MAASTNVLCPSWKLRKPNAHFWGTGSDNFRAVREVVCIRTVNERHSWCVCIRNQKKSMSEVFSSRLLLFIPLQVQYCVHRFDYFCPIISTVEERYHKILWFADSTSTWGKWDSILQLSANVGSASRRLSVFCRPAPTCQVGSTSGRSPLP
jgi:hypothetical protein